MPTSVALTTHFEVLTQQLVASGRYNNVSEVVRDGLRLLESRVQEEAARVTALREAAQQGFDALERGDYFAMQSDQEIASFVQQAGLSAKAATAPARKSA